MFCPVHYQLLTKPVQLLHGPPQVYLITTIEIYIQALFTLTFNGSGLFKRLKNGSMKLDLCRNSQSNIEFNTEPRKKKRNFPLTK